MAKKIIINVSAKTLTIPECVKFTAGQNISDSIQKNVEYSGNSSNVVTFNNYCNQSFNIPEIELYSNTENGGNFRVYVSAFPIGANLQVNIPVKYSGIYKGNASTLTFSFNYNGVAVNYTINVSVPVVHTPPTISGFSIARANRQDYTFTLADFTSHYNSVENATFSSVILSVAGVSNYRLNNIAITSGTEITSAQINSGLLKFVAPDTNNTSDIDVSINVKDSNGLSSLTSANLKVTNAALCTAPTLSDVTVNTDGSVTYTWNNNNISYTNGTTQLQLSYDGGANYQTISTVSTTSSPQTVTSPVFANISNGQTVKFRVICSGGYCNNIISNVVERVFNKPSEVSISNVVYSQNNKKICFTIDVVNQPKDVIFRMDSSIMQDGDEYSNYVSLKNNSSLIIAPFDSLAYYGNDNVSNTTPVSLTVGSHNFCVNSVYNYRPVSTSINSTNFSNTFSFSLLDTDNSLINGCIIDGFYQWTSPNTLP